MTTPDDQYLARVPLKLGMDVHMAMPHDIIGIGRTDYYYIAIRIGCVYVVGLPNSQLQTLCNMYSKHSPLYSHAFLDWNIKLYRSE